MQDDLNEADINKMPDGDGEGKGSAPGYDGNTADDGAKAAPAFHDILLQGADQLLGESDQGDSTPMLIEEALDRAGVKLRDQSNGREIKPNLGDMGLFLRQAMQAGACVDMPMPGDIVVFRYRSSRLHWSAIVETVGPTEMGVFISHPAPAGEESEYERKVINRRGINDGWRVVGFIRL
ncbi:MAG: hypothetical protein M5R41_10350 [Bacteroidia bacterium]|nr:hypothetical protein [Bacteroidia bacterium]